MSADVKTSEADTRDERRGQPALVRVFTGSGEGKTAAALGLALRAIGRGMRVFVVQFLRGAHHAGERELAERLAPDLEIRPMGREPRVNPGDPDPVDVKWAADGVALARNALIKGGWDVVLLEDVNLAVSYGLLDVDRVLDLIDLRPATVELVLTGCDVHPEVIAAADLVTELTQIKNAE
ncbi:MAG: cob(I)yrinic acid a,c-diamide adenosyltransferase [bacterium]